MNFADRVGMTNDQKSLSDIKMKPYIVFMLYQHGYETLADLAHLSNADILRMPRMGGSEWRMGVSRPTSLTMKSDG